MLERFSAEARQVVTLAQDQARGMGHGQVGTEHLLLGLIAEETGAAGRAFAKLGVTLDAARDAVMAMVRPGEPTPPEQPIPFSPRAKGTLEASLRQAMGFKDTSIDTEHILLALLIERDGRTASVFASLACPPDLLRTTVMEERGASATPDPHDDGDALLVLAEGSGVAGRALDALGVTPDALRTAIERARTGS
jgi:ATP-dependent Clp protease ATP-binding subunit ClpC